MADKSALVPDSSRHNRSFTEQQMTIIRLYEESLGHPRFGIREASGEIPVGPLTKKRGQGMVRDLKSVYFTREMLATLCGFRDESFAVLDVVNSTGFSPSQKFWQDNKVGNLTRFDRDVLKKVRAYWEESGITGEPCYFYAVPIHQVVIDPRNGYAKLVCENETQPMILVPKTIDAAMNKWKIRDDDFLEELAICAFWIVSHRLVMIKQVWSEQAANELVRGWRPYLDRTHLWPFFQNFVKNKIASLKSGR